MSNGILQFSLILRFVKGKSNLEHHCFKSTRLEKNWFYKIFLNLFTGDAKSFCSCASGIRIIKKSLSGLETSIKLNDRPIDWMHRNKILLIFTLLSKISWQIASSLQVTRSVKFFFLWKWKWDSNGQTFIWPLCIDADKTQTPAIR